MSAYRFGSHKPIWSTGRACLSAAVPMLARLWNTGSHRAIYYNGGNVGIGIANPSYPLDISTPGIGVLRLNGDALQGVAPMLTLPGSTSGCA